MNRMTKIVKQTQDENSRNELRILPSTLDHRELFRNSMEHQLNHSTRHQMPWIERYESVDVIDSESIIEINNLTASERKIEFMRNIINYENISDNSYSLVSTSSNQVRTYIHDLLIRMSMNENIREEDLYRIGNIFLYTIANINEEGVIIRDIIQHLRDNLVQFNTNRILNILENHISVYNDYSEAIQSATADQLEMRTKEFYQQIEEQAALNRRRIVYVGLGLVASMILVSVGLPPIGGVITRTIANIFTN